MIVSIAFTWQEGQAAVVPLHHAETPWRDPDAVARILGGAIRQTRAKCVAHNGKFDARWMHTKSCRSTNTSTRCCGTHAGRK